MKKLFITAALLFAMTTMTAQKNYDLDAPKTETQLIGKAEKTADTATYKDQNYTVYQSVKGKLFIVYINKKGNPAKKYIST